jgi:hypothetical protein
MAERTRENIEVYRRRERPRSSLERTFSVPLSHPFLTSFVILPGCIAVFIWFVSVVVGETRWPPEHEHVELCVIYADGEGRLRNIEGSRGAGFEVLQEKLLKTIAEGSTFLLPAGRQGEWLRTYEVQFIYRILGTDGEGLQRIWARCEDDGGRFSTTVYDVSPDLIIPVSYQAGLLPLTVAAWSYPIMGMLVFPILYIAGKRTRRRLTRRQESSSAAPDPAPIRIEEERPVEPPRRRRRRRQRPV